MGFRLVPTSMTLDDPDRRNSPYFAFFADFHFFASQIVEYRPILSVNIVSHFQFSTFGHYSPTLQRGLSAIAELLVVPYSVTN